MKKKRPAKSPHPPIPARAAQGRRSDLCLFGSILALAFLVYGNTCLNGYVLDDRMVITDNSFTKAGIRGIVPILRYDSFRGYLNDATALLQGGRYRPLSLITFAIERDVFGENPSISHFVNVVLFALTCMLIAALVRRLAPAKAEKPWYRAPAFLTAVVFLIHPIHTEVIANIKGRDEILALLLALAALWYSLRFVEGNRLAAAAASGMFLFAALLAKESAVTFCATVPLALRFFRNAPVRKLAVAAAPLFAAAALYGAIRFAVVGFHPPAGGELLNNPFLDASIAQKYATIAYTLLFYVRLLVVPWPLTYDYGPYHIRLTDWQSPLVWTAAVVYGLLAFAAVRYRRSNGAVSFSILYFLLSLSVVSNCFVQTGTFMAERFLYSASLGFCLLCGSMLSAVLSGPSSRLRTGAAAAAMAAAVVFSGMTVARNRLWRDNDTLTTTDVAVSKRSALANTAAADFLIIRVRNMPEGRLRSLLLDSAFNCLHRAIAVHPRYGRAHAILAEAYLHYRPYSDSALVFFRRLAAIDSAWPNALYNSGTVWLERHPAQPDTAIALLAGALRMFPNHAGAWKNLGAAYFYKSDLKNAVLCFEKAASLDPADLRLLNNGLAAATRLGDSVAAESFSRRIRHIQGR